MPVVCAFKDRYMSSVHLRGMGICARQERSSVSFVGPGGSYSYIFTPLNKH